MANLTAFYDTRNLFREFTGYTKPLSYEEWNSRPTSHKAALLFIQFFSQITLAWEKANAFDFIDGEDGVSTMCQYLEKNVPILEQNEKRFTPSYMYRVAYNCLYCICHDRLCDKERWENETPRIIEVDGKEFDLFDAISDLNGSAEDCAERDEMEREFWEVIEDVGVKAEKVLRYLIANCDKAELKKVNSRTKRYDIDVLRDVNVTVEEAAQIIDDLKKRFLALPEGSACKDYIAKFAT